MRDPGRALEGRAVQAGRLFSEPCKALENRAVIFSKGSRIGLSFCCDARKVFLLQKGGKEVLLSCFLLVVRCAVTKSSIS